MGGALKIFGGIGFLAGIFAGFLALDAGFIAAAAVAGPILFSSLALAGLGEILEHVTVQTEILKQVRDGKTAPAAPAASPKQMTDAEFEAEKARAAKAAASIGGIMGAATPPKRAAARTEPVAPKL